jgi:hypothetical protein
MAKKKSTNVKPPRTIGELRKLLAKLGNPWQPDPRLSDEELIPDFPTGGDDSKELPGQVLTEGGVIDFLKKNPPMNPFLREVWEERGLLDKPNEPKVRTKKQQRPQGRG